MEILPASRSLSIKIRIETLNLDIKKFLKNGFQKFIHQNKDWNERRNFLSKCWSPTSRSLSIKIRIETYHDAVESGEVHYFQKFIHQNKDWNTKPSLLPQKSSNVFQKFIHQNKDWNCFFLATKRQKWTSRSLSIKIRIETWIPEEKLAEHRTSRSLSIKIRIETWKQTP